MTLYTMLTRANDHYSEQLIRMEYMNTAPLSQHTNADNDNVSTSLGLPVDSKYCAVLGRLFKIHPIFDEAIIRILAQSPPSVYILLVAENVFEINEIVIDRLVASAHDLIANSSPEMISSLLSRVRLVDYSMYSNVIAGAECILDTFPYGGCLTGAPSHSHTFMVTHNSHNYSSYS